MTAGEHLSPLAYSVAGAATATGLGPTTIRGLLTSGSLPRHCCGTKPVILAEDLLGWLRNLPDAPTKA